MRFALGQLQIIWEDKQANLKKIKKLLELLQKRDLDLLLLPEMSLTGFSMNTEKTGEENQETRELFERLSAEFGIAIGFGWVKKTEDLCENHYSLAAPEGMLLDYVKLHPFRFGGEDAYFRGGEELPVCELGGFSVGTQICYDLRFPEPFQILSDQAELILIPANWPAKRREHWMALLKARAIETVSYLAGINCAGEMGDQYYSGDSGLYDPDGQELTPEEILCTGVCPEEKVLIYEIENDVQKRRELFPVKLDRRKELYGILKP